MAPDINRTRKYLKDFDFKNLFIEELGWDHCGNTHEVSIDSNNFNLNAVAEKRGMVAFVCSPLSNGNIPDYAVRRKIERQIAKSVHEHLIIYNDNEKTTQIWQWVKREAGKPTACREHAYHIKQPGDSLIQKILNLAVTLDEEETITIIGITGKAKTAFDVEKVTKKFYDRFKNEHDSFLKFIEGIPDDELHRWYASVMLNRLMFIYFIQSKGFLNNDTNYLKNKLTEIKQTGEALFYKKFLCPLFFEGFAKKASERSSAINKLLGEVPYLNGGLFLKHQIEERHGRHIEIADKAFEKLFDFFEQYQWHLDERLLKKDNEINPDVLGYIFEKYINQKQMGAYYTKEDITEYISKNTVIPFLFDVARQKCKIAFEGEQSVWKLLQSDPDRYIYPAVRKGVDLPLSAEIEAGIKDVSKRTGWNKPALPEYALPTEIWREVVARRQRYEEVKSKMLNSEIQSINDLITYNLDIRQFAQDVIENSEGPELLRAFYHAIEKVTVLDPTCGSGAFLFAALNILEPLYEACLDRMQVFLDEMERSDKKHRSDKYGDFQRILKKAEEHPNLKYFIFKSIIVNNLYGVDIIEEAIEICKLRLFLKLVAQIDSIEHIEPLPDIDFNIRAGNTLVGFATYEELKQTLQSDLISLQSLPAIEEKAQDIDRLFRLFQKMQTEQGMDSQDFINAKDELQKRLKALENVLNYYLAGEYGVKFDNKTITAISSHSRENGNPEALDSCLRRNDNYQKWLKSHQPFHWFIEFYGILKSGGFDVIIGNPPYVDYKKVKNEYCVKDYKTEDCGNIYAFCVERALSLIRQSGSYYSMIVPISLVGNDRFRRLRKILLTSGNNWFSHFSGDTHPGTLFTGVQQNLCIFVHNMSDKYNTYTTEFLRFADSTGEREFLFQSKVNYMSSAHGSNNYEVFKLGNLLHGSIYNKLQSKKMYLYPSESSYKSSIWYHDVIHYWFKCFVKPPYFKRKEDAVSISSHYKCLNVLPEGKSIIPVLLSSSMFYFWYIIRSNGRDVSRTDVCSFPSSVDEMSEVIKGKLCSISQELLDDLNRNKKRVVYQKKSGDVTYDQYWPEYSKPIIDEIDRVLAKHYCFTDEELDFIINYDIKYRMGRESEEGE